MRKKNVMRKVKYLVDIGISKNFRYLNVSLMKNQRVTSRKEVQWDESAELRNVKTDRKVAEVYRI